MPGLGDQPVIAIDVDGEQALGEGPPTEPRSDSRHANRDGEHRRPRGRDRGERSSRRPRERRGEEALAAAELKNEEVAGGEGRNSAIEEAEVVVVERVVAPPRQEPMPVAQDVERAVETTDAASRKWQPPSATVNEPPSQPKAGWWRRKSG